MWGHTYEQVKFLKVTFKYWCLDICEGILFHKDVSVQMLQTKNRAPELRYSYDPDNENRAMDANNIMKRPNSKHIIGSRLNKPWYFRLRPTFARGVALKTSCNPWFDTSVVFHQKTPVFPNTRNGYLWDFLSKFDTQRIACQRTITVGLKGKQNFSAYVVRPYPEQENFTEKDPFNTDHMLDELSQLSEPDHSILRSFDSSTGFDVTDSQYCPLEEMQMT